MKIQDIIKQLEIIAPPELAEPYDIGKIGLVLNRNNDIKKIAIALDPTDYVLNECVKNNVNLLITHHPLIFHPINIITYELSNTLKTSIENNISIYTMHTNFDKVKNGINNALADVIGLKNRQYLPIGIIGEMIDIKFPEEFSCYISEKLKTLIRVFGSHDAGINKVMFIGGSGFTQENITLAKNHNVDAFISGDMNYHICRYMENIKNMLFIDATHYATEIPGMKALVSILERRLDVKEIICIENPIYINYFNRDKL